MSSRRVRTSEKISLTRNEKKILAFVEKYVLRVLFPEDEAMRKMYLGISPMNPEYIQTWLQAFTDPTASDRNYEVLETLGDEVTKTTLVTLIEGQFPTFQPSEISNMKAYYASNSVFSEIARLNMPNIDDYIQTDDTAKRQEDTPVDVYEEMMSAIVADVFEACFGALFNVAEAQQRGSGHFLATKLFYKFFQNWSGGEIDISYRHGDYKTRVFNIFNRIGLGEVGQLEIGKSNVYKDVQVILRENQIEFLNEYEAGLNTTYKTYTGSHNMKEKSFKGTIIGQGSGPGIGSATKKAFEQALEYLGRIRVVDPWSGKKVELGVEWSTKVKAFKDIQGSGYLREMKTQARKEGFQYFTFEVMRKHSIEGHLRIVRLLGVKVASDGSITESKLSVGRSTGDSREARNDAIRKYLGVEDEGSSKAASSVPVKPPSPTPPRRRKADTSSRAASSKPVSPSRPRDEGDFE